MRALFLIGTVVYYLFSSSNSSQSINQSPTNKSETTELYRTKKTYTYTPTKRYTPDNNPVTWDEDPDNYPHERPHTYINVDFEEVQSPTYYDKTPTGACAICRDGTYSFSKNRRGTCSRHGGVAQWLK